MPNRIERLSPILANQIAAGEVVERPGSVIKELLENSIDAQATDIHVTVENGGMSRIHLSDNGQGIVKDDLSLALVRHATSKIKSQHDLLGISSLGFRGEALASMAAVSRLRLSSKPAEQELAWQCYVQGLDCTPQIHPTAHPNGTSVEVSDLFFNTPGRRRFLKSAKTEFHHINEVIKRFALSHPTVGLMLKHNEKCIQSHKPCEPQDNGHKRVASVMGQTFSEHAVYIEQNAVGLSLKGWVGDHRLAQRHLEHQFFFVNQRHVRDKVVSHALKSVLFDTFDFPEGTHPSFVLFLEVDPNEVDVNVHPTKHEVRFAQSRWVHDFMTQSLIQGLQSFSPKPFAPPVNTSPKPHAPAQTAPVKPHPKPDPPPLATSHQEIPHVCFEPKAPPPRPTVTPSEAHQKFYRRKVEHEGGVWVHQFYIQEIQNDILVLDVKQSFTSILKAHYLSRQTQLSDPLLFPQTLTLSQELFEKAQKSEVQKKCQAIGIRYNVHEDKRVSLLTIPFALAQEALDTLFLDILAQERSLCPLEPYLQAVDFKGFMRIPQAQKIKLIHDFVLASPKDAALTRLSTRVFRSRLFNPSLDPALG